MYAHLVHGFNVRDNGANTMDRLAHYFQQKAIPTLDHDYGWRGLLGVRFCNGLTASLIAAKTLDDDIGVGHSNGCALLVEAARNGAPFAGLVLINPALDTNTVFPESIRWIHVYHNSGDLAVRVARVLRWHVWGAMGARGCTAKDPRVKNFDCGRGKAPCNGHSDIFNKLDYWGPLIVARVKRALIDSAFDPR